ncbi:transmembrane emp24 domain-containing protein 6-like [Branchiostoma floridae x Branchiostoma japonicum]
MSPVRFFVFCAMIAVGAGNVELSERLDEHNQKMEPHNREVFFHVAIEIPPRKMECFFQHVGENAELKVNFMVLEGAAIDQNIVMKMWDPSGEEIEKRMGSTGDVELHMEGGHAHGTYKFCLYNLDKIFKKAVDFNVQLTSVDWREYTENLPEDIMEDLDKTHMTESFTRLHRIFRVVALQIEVIKRRMFADFLTVKSNLTYVDRLGLLNCMVIIGSGMVQVFFVRKMFETPNVRGSTNKT